MKLLVTAMFVALAAFISARLGQNDLIAWLRHLPLACILQLSGHVKNVVFLMFFKLGNKKNRPEAGDK